MNYVFNLCVGIFCSDEVFCLATVFQRMDNATKIGFEIYFYVQLPVGHAQEIFILVWLLIEYFGCLSPCPSSSLHVAKKWVLYIWTVFLIQNREHFPLLKLISKVSLSNVIHRVAACLLFLFKFLPVFTLFLSWRLQSLATSLEVWYEKVSLRNQELPFLCSSGTLPVVPFQVDNCLMCLICFMFFHLIRWKPLLLFWLPNADLF